MLLQVQVAAPVAGWVRALVQAPLSFPSWLHACGLPLTLPPSEGPLKSGAELLRALVPVVGLALLGVAGACLLCTIAMRTRMWMWSLISMTSTSMMGREATLPTADPSLMVAEMRMMTTAGTPPLPCRASCTAEGRATETQSELLAVGLLEERVRCRPLLAMQLLPRQLQLQLLPLLLQLRPQQLGTSPKRKHGELQLLLPKHMRGKPPSQMPEGGDQDLVESSQAIHACPCMQHSVIARR